MVVVALEPLAETIRTLPDIHGYNAAYTTNTISLYADDIILCITQPQTFVPTILSVVHNFGTFAGYRINWGGS